MGNALCCASPEDGIDMHQHGLDEKKPKLFGKMHGDSSDSDSDQANAPVEERLKDLVPKIRAIKKQLDACQKQQVRLRDEVQTKKEGDTTAIMEAIMALKRQTDQRQVQMTQECEKILDQAEKIQREKLRSRISYQHSDDEDPMAILHNHEANLGEFQDDLKKYQAENRKNIQAWTQWQNDQNALQQSTKVSKEAIQQLEKQLEKAKNVNVRMLKLLGDISGYAVGFRALRDAIEKPEVAVDYRDLEYAEKLEFVDGVEPPLEFVTQMVHRAKAFLETLEKEYESITDKQEKGPEVYEVVRKLRENDELQTLTEQEAEVKKSLQDLKERRKRFGDCNVQSQLNARGVTMNRIKSLYDGTKTKFNESKTNVEGLLTIDSTKPERKAILEECKANELTSMESQIGLFDPAWVNLQQVYDSLANEIGDYGELLKDCELQVCCSLIERMGTMQEKLKNTRKAIADMDSAIDLLRVKIGEVDVAQAAKEYLDQEEYVKNEFIELNQKGELLITYAEECEEYASDREERELAESTKGSIRAFLKSVSVKQTEVVEEKLQKLQRMNRDYQNALNKDDVKRGAFKVINDLERMFAKMNENIENGWKSLEMKYRHYGDFDLNHKKEKRQARHATCETLTVQIKDNVASLLLVILEKLDSNITRDDRASLKQIQQQTQEFQREIQRFLNNNTELGRELEQLAGSIPRMTPQVKHLDHFDSIKSQLELMKAFGEKLELQELRMATIKDKIEIFAQQVECIEEQPEQPAAQQEATVAIYTPVDPSDPIEALLVAAVTPKFAGVTIVRQTAGLYLINGKSVTVAAEGENKDQLKVRVGSSWFAFNDYMSQVKTRVDRESEEEDDSGSVEIKAVLEQTSDSGAATPSTPSGKKKKKKKAKKKAAADLDLDMDNDDAAEQTRFAGIVKTSSSADNQDAAEPQPSPKKKRRMSVKGKIPKLVANLDALAEVDEDDDESSHSGDEETKQD